MESSACFEIRRAVTTRCIVTLAPLWCHEQVRAAALQITAKRGFNEFTAQEVVDTLHAAGSSYAESAIRTHVVSRCCINAPAHHAVRYDYFERVGHGRYRVL